MVEINNQRKAFLDMLAWSEELITDVRKPEIMVMTSFAGESCLLITPITLANLSAKPKTPSTGAGRYQLLSRWWDAYRKQRERPIERSGRCGIAADGAWRFTYD